MRLVLAPMLAACVAGCGTVSTQGVESRLQTLAFQPNMYVVQAGDTVATVAFRYQLSPEELVEINPGIGQHLQPGSRINVRPGTELSSDLREGAFLPRNADRVAASQAPVAAQRAPVTAPTAAGGRTVTDVVTAPVATQPRAQREIIITEAAYDPITGGHPNEEVIADDLDVVAPSNGYTPVPAADSSAALNSAWVWPTDGAVARGFAPERIGGQGVDIAGVPGQDVRAAASGTVVYSGKDPSGSGGSLVILRHADDLMTTYSHADKLFVTEDDVVLAGDPIASLGWNESSESVLSFEVRRGGAPLDPLTFVTAR